MDPSLASLVRERAKKRCEYCHHPEPSAEVPFQIEHIIARQHGGTTTAENLALACCFCNRYKGPNLSGVDPTSNEVVRLFHPRVNDWEEHFEWRELVLIGKTAVGRATICTLNINRSDTVAVRKLLVAEGVYRL